MNTLYEIENDRLNYLGKIDTAFNTLSAKDLVNTLPAQNFISSQARFGFIPTESKWLQMTKYGKDEKQWLQEFKFRVFNKDLTKYKDFDIAYETKIELNVV